MILNNLAKFSATQRGVAYMRPLSFL